MRRGFGIGFLILAILVLIGIGSGAYHLGYVNGLDANGSVQIVHTVGGGGFFPGFFLFPLLFLFLIFGIGKAAFWGGRHHHGDHDHQAGPPGWGDRRQVFEDWHRRQHEPAQSEGGSAGGEPAR